MPTLRALLEVLGPAVSAVTPDAGLDTEVDEVVLVGPGDPLPDLPGALLVCTSGVTFPVTAAAVVVRALDESLAGAPIPVLAADPSLPWNHLLNLLTAACSASGSSSSTGDLFALANSVAAMVGGATAVEDPHRRVLAYSSLPDQPIDDARQAGILGRQVPDRQGNDSLYRDLVRSNGVLRVPADGDVLPRLAVAVRSGAEVLGSIWVIEATPLGPEAEQALLDAGRLASLHLLRARAGRDVERRARGELLRGLLDGRSAPSLAASRLGVDEGRSFAVLAFGLPESVAVDEIASDAVADLVMLHCAGVRPRSAVVQQLGTVYALLPSDDLPRDRLVQLASAVVERAASALRVQLSAGVGSTVSGLAGIGRSRADADAVLRITSSVAAVESVQPQVVLLDLQSHLAGATHLQLPAVLRMLEHDQLQGTPYAESVLAYLAANSDVPAAAESVNVHPNTFRYRLRRVRELFDLDLEDPDVRLVVWLQLRARR